MGFSCVICSDSLTKNPVDDVKNAGQEAKISAVPCGHFFHHFCISKWLQGTLATSKKCPCCRKDVPKSKCLPLFPTVHDESILDDSVSTPAVPCGHEPQLRDLRSKSERLERSCSELETILQTVTEDLESERSKLQMERKRSDKYMFQCKMNESLQDRVDSLEAQLSVANTELTSLKAIQDCVNGIRQESEVELTNWPVSADSVKCLVDIKVVLSNEIRGQIAKTKDISNQKTRIKTANHDLSQQLQKCKNRNEELENENEHLKLEIEHLRSSRVASTNSEPHSDKMTTPRRKRKSDVVENVVNGNFSNADDSVVVLSPEIDEDIAVLQPFHKNAFPKRKIGITSSSDLTSSSVPSLKPKFNFKKKIRSVPDCLAVSGNLPTSSTASTTTYCTKNLKPHNPTVTSRRKIHDRSMKDFRAEKIPGSSSKSGVNLPKPSKDNIMDVELSPLDFQANIKSSLPGLTDTPISQMNSRFHGTFGKSGFLSKRSKVLQK